MIQLRLALLLTQFGIWPVLAGMGLVLCALLQLIFIPQLSLAMTAESKANVQIKERLNNTKSMPMSIGQAQEAQNLKHLNHLDEVLLSKSNLTSAINRTQALAKRSGIVLKRSDFSTIRDQESQTIATSGILTAQGNYYALRDFSSAALREMPFLSIESIQVRRESQNTPLFDAQIKITYWHRIQTLDRRVQL